MRNRIPPPILTVVSVGLIFCAHKFAGDYSPNPLILRPIGGVLTVLGFAILIWAGVLFKAKKTTVNPFRPKTTSSIVSSGPYRITRNPMYLGMLLLIVAAAFWWPHWWLTIPIIAIFYIYMTTMQIIPEERALEKKFGSEYTRYTQKVRRWL